jgi:hypothetical protein
MQKSLFIGLQGCNPATYPWIRILNGTGANVHAAPWSKCIEIQVQVNLSNGLRAVIGIYDYLFTVVSVRFVVQVYIYGIVGPLLPVAILEFLSGGKKRGCNKSAEDEERLLHNRLENRENSQ